MHHKHRVHMSRDTRPSCSPFCGVPSLSPSSSGECPAAAGRWSDRLAAAPGSAGEQPSPRAVESSQDSWTLRSDGGGEVRRVTGSGQGTGHLRTAGHPGLTGEGEVRRVTGSGQGTGHLRTAGHSGLTGEGRSDGLQGQVRVRVISGQLDTPA